MYSYKGVDSDFKYKIGVVEAENEVEAAKKIKEEEGIVLITSVKKTNSMSAGTVGSIKKKILSIENSFKVKRLKTMKEKDEKAEKKKSTQSTTTKNKQPNKKTFGLLFFKKEPKIKKSQQDKLEEQIAKMFKENSLIGNQEALSEKSKIADEMEIQVAKKKAKEGKALNMELIEGKKNLSASDKKKAKMKAKPKEILMFTRRFQIMLSSGVSLLSSLTTLEQSSEKSIKRVLSGVVKDINAGSSLSAAFAKYPKVFGSTYVSLISIGETSGELDSCLLDIIKTKEREQKVTKKVKTAMVYPGIIAVFLVILMFAASIFFLPKFEEMFAEQDLPMPHFTTVVFGIAGQVPIIAAIIGVIIVAFMILKNKFDSVDLVYRKIKDKLSMHIPLVHKVSASLYFYYFSSTVALMLKNGIRLSDTLQLASKSINNIYIQDEIKDIERLMIRGLSFSEAMNRQHYFETLLVNIVKTGEESGQMVECLEKISNYYGDELQTTVDQLMEAVPLLSIIAIGAVVGPIVIAAYLPIFEISSGSGVGL